MSEKSFKLCLTMAGAVSAGAYTAGVLDELFHVLDLWEKQRQRNRELGKAHPDYDHSIPMHRVSLEIMSGASAGGIAAALSLQKLLDTKYDAIDNNKLLQDCWVTMADDTTSTTLKKLLDPSDIDKSKTPYSLLNGGPITELAETYFKPLEKSSRPPWVSPRAEVILTTTNLEGIEIGIHFEGTSGNSKGHVLTQHSSVFRFRPEDQGLDDTETDYTLNYYPLDLTRKVGVDYLKNAALSTSAFPVGLPARKVRLPHKPYLRFDDVFKDHEQLKLKITSPERFNAIDGGLLNNEPYGWGVKLLQEKCPEEYAENRFAVIMIDPLPHTDPKPQERKLPDMFKVMTYMFRSLRNEVMMNQEGILKAIAMQDRTRYLIAPSKGKASRSEDGSNHTILAAAPLSGFAGFIAKERRAHDYELGRRNCRDFIRFYLTLPLEKVPERLGISPTNSEVSRFGINPEIGQPVAENPYFPIIPDMRLGKASEDKTLPEFPENKNYPVYPPFNLADFKKEYGVPINSRIKILGKRIIKNVLLYWAFLLLFKGKCKKMLYEILRRELPAKSNLNPQKSTGTGDGKVASF